MMEHLLEGFRRFKSGYWVEHRDLFGQLAHGQAPQTLVVSCSDSRVDPQLIFNTVPGEIFAIRNVANLVPPYAPDSAYHGTSAALEFGVRSLKVRDLVVLGHGKCGGIQALLQGDGGAHDFVMPWMRIAERAKAAALAAAPPEAAQTHCEHEGIKVSLDNLLTFPWIRERVEAGSLALHGVHYDIDSGELRRLTADGTFQVV